MFTKAVCYLLDKNHKPHIKVEKILCLAHEKLNWFYMEKKKEEIQGHLEKIPASTEGISQKASPEGVLSYGGIIFPLGYV